MAVEPNMIDVSDGVDALDRLANKFNAADGADLAHDLANKKAKLAEQAHRASHADETSKLGSEQGSRTAFSRAFDASSDKLLSGGLMFAGFSTLLMGMMFAVPAVLTLLPFTVVTPIATVLSAAATGAVWLGGNEFYKVYKGARQEENSQLNKTIDGIKSRFGQGHELAAQREVGAMGVAAGAGASLADTVEKSHYENAARQNPAIQAILEAGPRARAQDILAQGSKADLSAEQRAEQSREAQAHHSV